MGSRVEEHLGRRSSVCHQHEAPEPEAVARGRAGKSRDRTQDGALPTSGVGHAGQQGRRALMALTAPETSQQAVLLGTQSAVRIGAGGCGEGGRVG